MGGGEEKEGAGIDLDLDLEFKSSAANIILETSRGTSTFSTTHIVLAPGWAVCALTDTNQNWICAPDDEHEHQHLHTLMHPTRTSDPTVLVS